MSWLLFMDESGHDHRNMPYEVRGGIALHTSRLWPFVQAVQRLELDAFGARLSEFKTEIKGCKLLDSDRFLWAGQQPMMCDELRRKQCRQFLTKGSERKQPSREDFTAYGQACLEMAKGIFELLRNHEAVLFAVAIPRGVKKPAGFAFNDYLRKDHVFLFERFYFLLEREKKYGLIIMDEVEKTEDRRFVKRLENYFQRTHPGRFRTRWIVPTPFFVSSDMAYPLQAADVCIYALNWGFRLPSRGMDAPTRPEIAALASPWLIDLQWQGDIYKEGGVFQGFGIAYVPDPYESRK